MRAPVTTFRDQITVVLHNPQRQINIAATVRAMMNMGIRHLRLVTPREYEPELIEHVAHRSADVVERIEVFASLPAALHDITWAIGTTARHRDTPLPRHTKGNASLWSLDPKTMDYSKPNWTTASSSSP
jgi:tRNA/rRNA methyltransferase